MWDSLILLMCFCVYIICVKGSWSPEEENRAPRVGYISTSEWFGCWEPITVFLKSSEHCLSWSNLSNREPVIFFAEKKLVTYSSSNIFPFSFIFTWNSVIKQFTYDYTYFVYFSAKLQCYALINITHENSFLL